MRNVEYGSGRAMFNFLHHLAGSNLGIVENGGDVVISSNGFLLMSGTSTFSAG